MDRPRILARIQLPVFVTKRDMINYTLAFLLGRAALFESAMPLGLAYLAAFTYSRPQNGMKAFWVAVAAAVGTYSALHGGAAVKYLLAFVLFGLIYTAVSTLTDRRRYYSTGVIATVALAISGIIYAAQQGLALYDLLMLGVECAACLLAASVIRGSVSVLYAAPEGRAVSKEDLAGLCVAAAGAVLGFTHLYIGAISLGSAFSILFMMVLSIAGGVMAGATGGIGIGVLCALSSFDMSGIVGIYGFCGLVSGILGRYRRAGVILGFFLASRLVSFYYGGYVADPFSLPELLIATVLLCLIPNSVLTELKLLVYNSRYENTAAQKSMDVVSKKIESVADALSGLAELFRSTLAPVPPNLGDISTLYDLAADKVCKRCGLKYICWSKEFLGTRDALNKLAATLVREKKVGLEDVPKEFASKCIKLPVFVNELNRIYHQYNVDKQEQDRLDEGRGLIAAQLQGVSEIVGGIAQDMEADASFEPAFESRIYAQLEAAGLRCTDVTVSRSADGRSVITVRLRGCPPDDETAQELVRQAAAHVMGRSMRMVSTSSPARGKCVMRLCETENFTVSCYSVSTARSGEQTCGDSVSCGYISGNRYAMILSDGMGCGRMAAKQSSDAVALLRQFLNAGFGVRTSVGMINSALMLGGSESFATIDAAVMDLQTGEMELIKAGANAGYIKGKGFVRRVLSDTLPIGIIKDTDVSVTTYKAQDGDMVILLSDGVHNANDDWFEQFISNLHEDDPQVLAQLLIDESLRQKNGKIEDDMTVIAAKIMKQ